MSAYIKNSFQLLFICLFFCACEKRTEIDLNKKPVQLVVLGEFNQTDDALVNLSTTKPDGNGSFVNVGDADVNLYDQNHTLLLKYRYQDNGNYTGAKASSGQTYQLAISYQGNTYPAQVTIPQSFTANVKIQTDDTFELQLNDAGAEMTGYVIELLVRPYTVNRYYFDQGKQIKVDTEEQLQEKIDANPGLKVQRDTLYDKKTQRSSLSTQDSRTDNIRYGELNTASPRIFLSDRSFNGQQTSLKITANNDLQEPDQTQLILTVRSARSEYYSYLYNMDLQKAKNGLNDIPLKGNITGALGIWGACYIQKIILKN